MLRVENKKMTVTRAPVLRIWWITQTYITTLRIVIVYIDLRCKVVDDKVR